MNCPKCQTPVSAEWVACPKCGTQLSQLPMGIAVTEVKRPSRWHYFAGIAIIVLTTVIAMAFFFSSIMSIATPDMRVAVPGNRPLNFDKAGDYLLLCEEQGSSSGSCDAISDMDIKLYDSASNPVELDYPSAEIDYEITGKSYEAIFEFEIDKPGTYTLNASYDGEETATIAISRFDITGVYIAFVIGTLGFIVGLIIVIRTAMKRSSVGRRTDVTPVDKFWA